MRVHVLAVAAVAGALLPWAVTPPLALAGVVMVGLAVRRGRWGITVAAAAAVVMGAGAATHARAGLVLPDPGRFDGWVVLVDDPRPSGPVGVRVTVRIDGQRLVASAHGPVAGRLDDALAGEQVRIVGTIRPVAADDARSLMRHVVGRVTVDEVEGPAPAAPVGRLANTVRRTLERGAGSLDATERALLLGMVIGDDRDQPPAIADDFRAAGLGHLLVVSGQNVAFVLAVIAPVAGRLRPAGRMVVLLAVLGLFAVTTRFEPSVLRATVMAGVSVGAAAGGRPVDGRIALSAAVGALVLVDPFLVHQLAFRLSAAATAGIVWAAAPIAERLPGPGWFTVPLATTTAAQLAVAPLLVATFGPMPLAALPANLLAGPVSGGVMVWGCTAGMAAGLIGGPVATGLHLPSRAMLWWVAEVAGLAAAGPQASLGPVALAAVTAAVVAAVTVAAVPRVIPAAVVAVAMVVAVAGAPRPATGTHRLDAGVTTVIGRTGTVVVLDDPARPVDVLEALREAAVARPGLVIARDGDRADADAVLALRDRFGDLPVAAPPLHRVPGGRVVAAGQVIEVGDLRVVVDAVEPRLHYSVGAVARGP